MTTNVNNTTKKPGPSRGKVGFYKWRGRNRPYNAPKEKAVSVVLPSDKDVVINLSSITQQENLNSFAIAALNEPYPGWNLYLPEEEYAADSSTVKNILNMEIYFKKNYTAPFFAKVKKNLWYTLNLNTLLNDEEFDKSWPTFPKNLIDKPSHTIACINLAVHQIVHKIANEKTPENPDLLHINRTSLKLLQCRLQGHQPITNLKSIRVHNNQQLLSVRGRITSVNASTINCSWLAFKCSSCFSQQAIKQNDNTVCLPSSCKNRGCKARSNFIPLQSSIYTRLEMCQRIKLEEIKFTGEIDSERLPRKIEIELKYDLVDAVLIGDDVIVTGIVHVTSPNTDNFMTPSDRHKIYIEAVSITSNINDKDSPDDSDDKAGKTSEQAEESMNLNATQSFQFSQKDMQAIEMIKDEPSPFRLLVHSLCPGIYGHEMVKAGLILGLFGGGAITKDKRNEIHVLMVGDPGVGKSQLLQACANLSPRGVFIGGNSTSSVGLTVTSRHEKGNVTSVEAGALVLADQGVCCIDEFDKMSTNYQALLEVMEQQIVSIAKSGILCSLPARTSILAAANPSDGHYNKSKTIAENVRMSRALLSRFDLAFLVLDNADQHLDNLLANHHYSNTNKKLALNTSNASNVTANSEVNSNTTLRSKLLLQPSEFIDTLPPILFKKYIAYARKNINPKLSDEAANLIKEFYLKLREMQSGNETLPITTRQLEALIRLTCARARVDLVQEATVRHAQEIIEIFRFGLIDILEHGLEDCSMQANRSFTETELSLPSQIKKFVRLLQTHVASSNKTLLTTDELRQIAQRGHLQNNYSKILETINVQGLLLKKSTNLYKYLGD